MLNKTTIFCSIVIDGVLRNEVSRGLRQEEQMKKLFTMEILAACLILVVNQTAGAAAEKTELEKDIEAGGRALSKTELVKFLTNNTLYAFPVGAKKPLRVMYFPKGKRMIALQKGNITKDNNWEINDDGEVCFKGPKTDSCIHFYYVGDEYWLYKETGDGSRRLSLKMSEGNPEGLK